MVELSNTGVPLSGSSGYQSSSIGAVQLIAIDNEGSAWVASVFNLFGALAKISSTGGVQAVYNGALIAQGLGMDGNGDAWYSSGGSSLLEYSNSGTLLSPSNGYSQSSGEVAVDGSGNVWLGTLSGLTEVMGVGVPVVTPLALGLSSNKLGARP